MELLFEEITHPAYWLAALQIIWINVLLSGDNAVVIALACRMLEPRQRFWGMILGAGVAVLLRIIFTAVVASIMAFPFLKLVGGLLLLWIAIKLLVPEEDHGEGKVKAANSLWPAVRIIAIADIVMSLDNVIAIAGAANSAAVKIAAAYTGQQAFDLAAYVKFTLITFGLATSVPLIIAGSALLMAMLDRFPILVWAGAGLLGWVAGEIIIKDAAVAGYLGEAIGASLGILVGGRWRDLRARVRLAASPLQAQEADGAAAHRRSAGTGGISASHDRAEAGRGRSRRGDTKRGPAL